jgi:MFS family permease
MPARLLDLDVLSSLTRDGRLLFLARILRLFGYGLVSVVLMLYLTALGFSPMQAGFLLTLTLMGDTIISLWITTKADRVGRKTMLVLGACLMLLAGIVFVLTGNFILLVLAATIGVISPSGNEVGPFLAIEQAALSHLVPSQTRTGVFAWYNLAGSVATAIGALVAGIATHYLQRHGVSPIGSYQVVLLMYAVVGGILALVFLRVTDTIEVKRSDAPLPSTKLFLGLHRSRKVVLGLSALFSLDAFAGGFVVQSLMAYWFHVRYGADEAVLGAIFCGANILAGISALTASRLAARFGLLNTMVFTHIPSNVLLILVPLMPNLPLAITVLLARFSISQMDVPTRQSYTMAVVDPDERSAAAGVTGVARTTGAALSPILAGQLLAVPMLFSMPFFLCGGLKIIYDLLLWRQFRSVNLHEQAHGVPPPAVKVVG